MEYLQDILKEYDSILDFVGHIGCCSCHETESGFPITASGLCFKGGGYGMSVYTACPSYSHERTLEID